MATGAVSQLTRASLTFYSRATVIDSDRLKKYTGNKFT